MIDGFNELGTAPISTDAPSGASVRYEPEFEQLNEEIAKQESLSAESTNWSTVVDLSRTILQEKSKDLLVASYLSRGLLENHGYEGLSVGLGVIKDMVDSHWDHLFPPAKRLRARSTAIEWLAEKAGAAVVAKPPNGDDAESVLRAASLLKEVDGLLFDKMGDSAPSLAALNKPLKDYKRAAEHAVKEAENKAAQKEAAPTSAPANDSPTQAETPQVVAASSPSVSEALQQDSSRQRSVSNSSSSAVALAGEIASEADARKVLKQIQDASRSLTSFWMATKLVDSRIYRINRMAAWLNIQKAPMVNVGSEDVTPIQAPAADKRKSLEEMFAQAQFAEVIPQIEQLLVKSPYWFNGHRMVSLALGSLGSTYSDAKNAVNSEVAHFLNRVPEVIKLRFADGTAFVDDQSMMWLQTEVQSSGGGSSSTDSGSSESGLWLTGMTDAQSAAASGKVEKGMHILEVGIASSAGVREQMYWRLALSEFLIQIGKLNVAIPQLEMMARNAIQYQLKEFEPKLAAAIQKHLYASYEKLLDANKKDKDPEVQNKLNLAFANLCELDPLSAMSIKGD